MQDGATPEPATANSDNCCGINGKAHSWAWLQSVTGQFVANKLYCISCDSRKDVKKPNDTGG